VARTSEPEGRVAGAPAEPVLAGDDITVLPGDRWPRFARARLWISAAIIVAVAGAAVAVIATRDDTSKPAAVQLETPPTAAAGPVRTGAATPKVKTPATRAKPRPEAARPTSVAPPAPRPVVHVPVPAPRNQPAVTPNTAPPATAPVPTSPPSVLQWTVPPSVTIMAGKTVLVAVMVTNPSKGVVTLPHPLSCAPRLDDSEVCSETVQRIAPDASASATYRLDAHGIAPGTYSLSIEGLHTITVTVIKATQ
jgi:hypothetical protein